MSKFKHTFYLRQHTPIIHFQHDQSGATLRATELKPKLDAYVISEILKIPLAQVIAAKDDEVIKKKLLDQFKEKGKLDWLVGEGKPGHLALDYKLRIKGATSNQLYIPIANELNESKEESLIRQIGGDDKEVSVLPSSPYFGNEENVKFKRKSSDLDLSKSKIDNLKYGILSDQKIAVSVFSKIPAIHQFLKENICAFFAARNFGTRQSKGFGSFYPDPDEADKAGYDYLTPLEALKRLSVAFIYFDYKEEVAHKYKFADVRNIYKLMKTGFNFPDHPFINGRLDYGQKGKNQFYLRSYLIQYLIKKYAENGVAINSEKKLIKQDVFRMIPPTNSEKLYIRSLLGVSEGVEFKGDGRIAPKGTIKYKSKQVERFKSPVTIKFIDNFLFFIPKVEESGVILNKTFLLKDARNGRSKTINTPNQFDIEDFLLSFANYYNDTLYNHIKSEYEEIFEDFEDQRRLPKAIEDILLTLEDVNALEIYNPKN